MAACRQQQRTARRQVEHGTIAPLLCWSLVVLWDGDLFVRVSGSSCICLSVGILVVILLG